MTGSGAPDLVGVSPDGKRLVVVPHNGLTNLHAALPSNVRATDIVQVLNVGDWNGDGRGDIITRQSGGNTLYLRPGLGNGTFAARHRDALRLEVVHAASPRSATSPVTGTPTCGSRQLGRDGDLPG